MNDKNERTESELTGELRAAHQIIRNALNLMTADQKRAWAIVNKRDGVIGEGTTRANERQAVIDKATSEASEQPLAAPPSARTPEAIAQCLTKTEMIALYDGMKSEDILEGVEPGDHGNAILDAFGRRVIAAAVAKANV